MGMYLMRQIGSRGVYGNPILPDFMVFLNWKELPFYWYGFDSFFYAALMVVLVPGALAFVFGWFAFRSRVTGVYLSIITQALTFALLLGFFRNNFGFGGNNGLTDFKDILGYPIRADATRSALFAHLGDRACAWRADHRGDRALEIRKGADRGARRREPHALPRLPRRAREALRLRRLGLHGGHRRRALCAAGRHHQSERIRSGELHRGGDLDRRRRPRHARRADHRRGPRQRRQELLHRRASRRLALRARRPLRRRHAVPAAGHRRHAREGLERARRAPPLGARRERRRAAARRAAESATPIARRTHRRVSSRRRRRSRRCRSNEPPPQRMRAAQPGRWATAPCAAQLAAACASKFGRRQTQRPPLSQQRHRLLRRLQGAERAFARRRPGRDARHHRPERRRQDDDDGRHHRQDPARSRAMSISRATST